MRRPIRFLFGTRLVGAYLRARVALLVAGILATVAATVVLGLGGVPGLLALLALVVVGFLVFGLVLFRR
jgi:hypothetical protein